MVPKKRQDRKGEEEDRYVRSGAGGEEEEGRPDKRSGCEICVKRQQQKSKIRKEIVCVR